MNANKTLTFCWSKYEATTVTLYTETVKRTACINMTQPVYDLPVTARTNRRKDTCKKHFGNTLKLSRVHAYKRDSTDTFMVD